MVTSTRHPENTQSVGQQSVDDSRIGREKTTDPGLATNTALAPLPTTEERTAKVTRDPIANGYIQEDDGLRRIVVTTQTERASLGAESFMLTLPISTTVGFPGPPVRIVGTDSTRSRLLFSNGDAANPVLVGSMRDITNGTGFIVPGGRVVELKVQSEIYACLPSTGVAPVLVGIWVEHN